MSDVSEAAKVKACELLNAANNIQSRWIWAKDGSDPSTGLPQVAAFIQQVSDAAKELVPLSTAHDLFAKFILPDPPVDPLLIEAREIWAAHWDANVCPMEAAQVRAGERDDETVMRQVLAALKRGMELAR